MKLIVIPITLREANHFVSQYHRHNGPVRGCKFAIGASTGEEMVGVAIVGRPEARLLQDGYTASVTRNCTNPDAAPRGTGSFLYAACWRIWRAMGGLKLVTYTLATESGASLRGAGWTIVAELKPRSSCGWSSTGRERDWQPIYGQQKLRWEKKEGEA